eukprot:PhF_6_TR4432/c0_g1_i1/m.5998
MSVNISYVTVSSICKQRQLASIPSPPIRPLESSHLWDPHTRLPRIDILKEHFRIEGALHAHDALHIIDTATNLFASEPNMLEVADPVTVVGDIHGQYYD